MQLNRKIFTGRINTLKTDKKIVRKGICKIMQKKTVSVCLLFALIGMTAAFAGEAENQAAGAVTNQSSAEIKIAKLSNGIPVYLKSVKGSKIVSVFFLMDGGVASFPKELSGGQQQRVAIARAMVKKPKLLLCDELTGALDSKSSKEVLQLIEQVNRDYGTTIVIITHNELISGMADRVLRIKDGKVVSDTVNNAKIKAEEMEL